MKSCGRRGGSGWAGWAGILALGWAAGSPATAAELRVGSGCVYATIADAVTFAERLGAGSLVLFHHGPGRVDDALDRIMDGVHSSIPVLIAREGMVIDLPQA